MALLKYQVTVIAKQDAPYNVLPNTAIAIRKVSDEALVQIYSDDAGLIPIPQPGATTDSRGVFEFYTGSEPVVKAEWTDGVNTYSETFSGNSLQALSGLAEPSDLDLIYSRGFASVADMKSASVDLAQIIDSGDVSAHTGGYYGGWAATVVPTGNANYILTTLQRARDSKGDPLWVPDGYGDHYLFGGTTYVAMLNVESIPNILQYGAIGNGVTDNLANFNASIVDNDAVYTPNGSYVMSGTFTLPLGKKVIGENYQKTFLRFSPGVTTGLEINGGCHIEEIALNGADTTDCIGMTIAATGLNNATATRVRVQDFKGSNAVGIKITDAVGLFFDQVFSIRNKVNLIIQGITGAFPTYMHFKDCAFREGDIGALLKRCYGVNFDTCLFEQNTLEGALIDVLDIVERVEFNNCWFERNNDGNPAGYQLRASGITGGATLEYTTVNKCFFFQGTAKACYFSKALATTFRENVINNRAGEVLFDSNSFGWIEDQRYGIKEGAIVDATGAMKDLSDLTYKEGAWTGVEVSNLNFTGAVFSEGKYIRIGNQVTLYGKWSGTVTAAAANTAIQFGGVPFSQAENDSAAVGVCKLSGNNFAAGTVFDSNISEPSRFFAGVDANGVTSSGAQDLTFSITYSIVE